jgi:lysine 2,3-aminomutase
VPVTLPHRLYDSELVEVIGRAGKVWIQTHFNHPREVTPEAVHVCHKLLQAGCPLNNHTVLLKGVNDSVETMRSLCRALLRAKVRPYYLFHCDPVTGAGHFRTSVWKGLEIIEGLRGHISGLGVPTYVVDAPRGGGKIPLMPNYLVSASDEAVVLRNYEGMLVRYNPDGHAQPDRPPFMTQGVSALLSGQRECYIPESAPRMLRRQAIAAELATAGCDADAAVVPPDLLTRGRSAARAPGRNGAANCNGHAATRAATHARAVVETEPPVLAGTALALKAIRVRVRRKKTAVG